MLNLHKGSRKTPANSFSMQVAAQAHEEVYHAADAMDWTPSQASRVGKSQVTNPNGYKSDRPEDRALLGKRALWVSKEVLTKRREEGRCLRCGRDGCLLRRCPLKPALPPSASDGLKPRGSNAKVVRPRITKTANGLDRLNQTGLDPRVPMLDTKHRLTYSAIACSCNT
jgi:hypothetical protein